MKDFQTLVCTEDACEIQTVDLATPVLPQARVLHIEMVSDWVCPYCPIGEAHLQQALQAFPELEVTLEYSPYMLNPDFPAEGHDREAYLLQKYGDLTPVRESEEKLTHMAAQAGWTYRYDRMDRSPNTLNAHRLALHALRAGKQPEIAELLFKAHFKEGKDLSDLQVLLDLAEQVGLDRSEVEVYLDSDQDRSEVREKALSQKPVRGIKGAPSFFFGGVLTVTGAASPEVFEQAIRQWQESSTL
ncbi:DsbA family oxidoreductase [Deinococcus misasensis]|uniref:DsbA family oxidoreductase n=1 Tax=Deinococcus misasensis TaxID=392413 RepID=UPI00068E88A4|nr:DsbA family oxidoreductase [Deinococcus misasensis]